MTTFYGEESRVILPHRVSDTPSRRSRMFGDVGAFAIGDRADLTTTAATGNYALAGRTLAWKAADNLAGNRFEASGRFLVLARNNSGSTQTIIMTSPVQPTTGLVYTQTLTLAPGDIGELGPMTPIIWQHADGYMHVNATANTVDLAVSVPT